MSVSGSGLRSSDHLVVEVKQLLRVAAGTTNRRGSAAAALRRVSRPGRRRRDQAPVSLTLPAGDFDDLGARAWVGAEPKPCYGRGNTTGCVRVHIPRPQSGRSSRSGGRHSGERRDSSSAQGSQPRPATGALDDAARLRIAETKPQRPLAEWSLAPDADGKFDRHLSVVVGHAYTDVCVVASLASREPACPARDEENGTVWSDLAVPPLN